MFVAVEDDVHTVIFQEPCNRPHLIVANRRIATRKGRLVKYNDFPDLVATVEVVNQPVSQYGGICWKGKGCRCVRRPAGEYVVEKVWVSIEKHEMRIAIIKRIVAHVVDLPLWAAAGVNFGAGPESFNSSGRVVVDPVVREEKVTRP